MNASLKTVLLTVLTLSLLTIAIIELTGISSTALWNKYEINISGAHDHEEEEKINDRLHHDAQRKDEVVQMAKTKISFEEDHFDFGTIKEGEKVTHVFKFINTGDKPLMIAEVIPSCGCTIPIFSKTPVLPNERGEISVSFDSNNRRGHQRKNIIVVSNADRDRVSISFTAEVE